MPIPKSGNDASCSDNYHPIALASTLSKVLEHIILDKYFKFFVINCLQFGFKCGSSTTTLLLLSRLLLPSIFILGPMFIAVSWMLVKLLI